MDPNKNQHFLVELVQMLNIAFQKMIIKYNQKQQQSNLIQVYGSSICLNAACFQSSSMCSQSHICRIAITLESFTAIVLLIIPLNSVFLYILLYMVQSSSIYVTFSGCYIVTMFGLDVSVLYCRTLGQLRLQCHFHLFSI